MRTLNPCLGFHKHMSKKLLINTVSYAFFSLNHSVVWHNSVWLPRGDQGQFSSKGGRDPSSQSYRSIARAPVRDIAMSRGAILSKSWLLLCCVAGELTK